MSASLAAGRHLLSLLAAFALVALALATAGHDGVVLAGAGVASYLPGACDTDRW